MTRHPDYMLVTLIGILVCAGLLILASASVAVSYQRFGSSSTYIVNQLLYGVGVGSIGFLVMQFVPYAMLRKLAIPILFMALVLLAAVFTEQFGFRAGGAQRWIYYKSIFFQPSELAKLAIVVYLAALFSRKRDALINFWQGTFPFILVVGLILALITLEPDIGTVGIIALTAGIMFFIAGGRLTYIGAGLAVAIALFFVLVQTAPYRMNRLTAFLHPELDPKGIGYQSHQALIAAGSGGVWGLGLGESRQKYSFLPESVGDSIFAITAEELGFVGASALVALFVLFALRSYHIAYRAPDVFGRYLAIGIASWISIQAFINMAAISSLVPLTGVTLPFVSYGGSSLALTLTACGILVNISKYARQ